MKRIAVLLMAAAMSFVYAEAVFAEDTKVSVGIKVWSNQWEQKIEPKIGLPETHDNGSAVMIGPSVNLRFPSNWFLGAAYLVSSQDYERKEWSGPGTPDTMTFERKDLDLTLGYMFNPYLGVFFGYKSINQDMTYHNPPATNLQAGSWTLKGPGIGLLGNIPLGETAAIYGNLALMSMKQNFQDPTGTTVGTVDMAGASIEIGFAMAFTESASANIGIKSQSFAAEDKFGTMRTETFAGLTAGLNFSF